MRLLLPLLLLVAGCTTVGPAMREMDARQFHAVPDKSVIYVVRAAPDIDPRPTVITLNRETEGMTYPGAFVRWIVAPGRHRIEGYGGDSGAIELSTTPGHVYFVRQSVSDRDSLPQSTFTLVTEEDGRVAVTAARVNAS